MMVICRDGLGWRQSAHDRSWLSVRREPFFRLASGVVVSGTLPVNSTWGCQRCSGGQTWSGWQPREVELAFGEVEPHHPCARAATVWGNVCLRSARHQLCRVQASSHGCSIDNKNLEVDAHSAILTCCWSRLHAFAAGHPVLQAHDELGRAATEAISTTVERTWKVFVEHIRPGRDGRHCL